MQNKVLRWLGATVLAYGILVSATAVACERGEPIDFVLPTLGGGQMGLVELRGHWVVLNYWATWCGPCRKEIPELSELHTERTDIVVLGLAYEEASPAHFETFLEEFEVSYPILLIDVLAPPAPFGAPRVMPTTILLDPEGRPANTIYGPVTSTMLQDWIEADEC